MAGIAFPKECRLSPAERAALQSILGKNETPCDGCAWAPDCPGPAAARAKIQREVANIDKTCPVCGSLFGAANESRTIPGSFHVCARDPTEFAFVPNVEAQEEDPNDITF